MKIKIDPADTMFSKAIRARDKQCVRCGKSDGLQVHHFFGRRYEGTRYEPSNVVSVCFTCHRFFHENPASQVEFMRERLGEKGFDILSMQASTYCKKDRNMRFIESKIYLELMQKENGHD